MAATWHIGPISTPKLVWGQLWAGRQHACPHCRVLWLTGEKAGFCCGPNGKYAHAIPPLPPLPHEFDAFLNDTRLSGSSRPLNLLFSFASMETSERFPENLGQHAFVAIQGRVYHRIRPSHDNNAVRWILYDGFLANSAPHRNWADVLPVAWIDAVRDALLRVNDFARALQSLSQLPPHICATAHVSLQDGGHSPEIAAVINYNNTSQNQVNARKMIVVRRDGQNQTIAATSRFWEPLAYPLLFPHGTFGWGVPGGNAITASRDNDAATDGAADLLNLEIDPADNCTVQDQLEDRGEVTTTQLWHYRALLLREARFRLFGRLTNEYLVDMFSRNLDCRLAYIRQNQLRVRAEDAALMGEQNVPDNENIYLPASFLGSWRWAANQVADCLAIAAALGGPTFFITITCNAQWDEIKTRQGLGQDHTDIPVDVVRVFKRKLTLFERALHTMFPNSGGLVYEIHSIEFQKRGLPHAHILTKFRHDCTAPEDIDAVISAEVPDDPADAILVQTFMVHHHPPANRPMSKYCQQEDSEGRRHCRFGYPQPLQPFTTIDAQGRVHYRRRRPGDEWIVPYCLPLLRKFRCHINFESASTSHLFQYLFKYVHKGANSVVQPFGESILITLRCRCRLHEIPHCWWTTRTSRCYRRDRRLLASSISFQW